MAAFNPEALGSSGTPPTITSVEEALWGEVVARAVLDLRNPEEHLRLPAAAWIFSKHEEEDFVLACQYAGLDPAWVRRMAARAQREAAPLEAL